MYDRPGSWFSRRILRRTSSTQSIKAKIEQRPGPGGLLKHKRSISDLSLRLKTKNDRLKDKDLQELVVLCGSSLLYLPAEYAVGSLAVPTCFRATAQYLVQYGELFCIRVLNFLTISSTYNARSFSCAWLSWDRRPPVQSLLCD